MHVTIGKTDWRNRPECERGIGLDVDGDVRSTPYGTQFLGKEVPDDRPSHHAAKRRSSIVRPHDAGDGDDHRPVREVARKPGGGEAASDQPELSESFQNDEEVPCTGPEIL